MDDIYQRRDGTMGEKPDKPANIKPLETFDAANWNGKTPEPRLWVTNGQIPCGEPGILSGDGGTGKTTIALQLANAVADDNIGDWLGKLVETHGPVIVSTAEEKLREIHTRWHVIRASRNLPDLPRGRAHFIAGLRDPFLARLENGIIKPTLTLHRLEKTVELVKPALVIVENAADVFAGNESDRVQVTQFVRGMLGGLCAPSNAAVMLLQHPSVAGLQDKSGRSGSTAWNNAGRWRLNFTFCNADDELDDTRQLKTEKINYGRPGEKFKVRWQNGVFVMASSAPTAERGAANASVDGTFMHCLDVAIAQGRTVSDSTGRNYAPAMFERMPEAKSLTSKAFEMAMERLFSVKEIEVTTIGKGKQKKRSIVPVRGIQVGVTP